MVGAGDGPDTALGKLSIVVEEVEVGFAIDFDIGQLAGIACRQGLSRKAVLQAFHIDDVLNCPRIVLRLDEQRAPLNGGKGPLEEEAFVFLTRQKAIAVSDWGLFVDVGDLEQILEMGQQFELSCLRRSHVHENA